MGPDGAPSQSVPWRKVLWERQPFPDNYVDQRFSEELRRNEGIRQYRYWAVVKEAGFVGQQSSCVAVFLTLWLYMEQGLLAPETLLWTSSMCAFSGYGSYQALTSQSESCSKTRTRSADSQSAALFLSFTFGFSPVLKTLTESVSTDTVYAMSALMSSAHSVTFPYAQPSPPGSLSLNAASFASVCLASRLPGASHTFAMLTCASSVFASWPCSLQRLRANAPGQFAGVCVGVCVAGVGGSGSQSLGAAVLLSSALVSVTLICPSSLVTSQRHKDNIHGPWDEAEIQEDLSRFLH